jgi:hypothetical protein
MANGETRPDMEDETPTISPGAHDAPGLSPFERMTELTRRIVNVPPKELAKERRRVEKKKRGHG